MKIKKYLVYGLIVSGFLSSCDLDKFPYNAIGTEKSFESVADAKNWDNRIHADIRGRINGAFATNTDIQADQLNATVDYGNRGGFLHRWTELYASDYALEDAWAAYYSGVLITNQALEGFATISPANDKEKAELNQYVGDAHLARAYYYFQLNTRWAKAYNASTASTDLSVPIITTVDYEAKPSRNTVAEVYAQIQSDLDVARTNLASLAGTPNANRFNVDVVTALEARVKLFKNDWAGAKKAATDLISGNKYKLYTKADDLKKMWEEDAGGEVIFAPFVSLTESANGMALYQRYNAAEKDFRPDFVPTKTVIDLYEEGDFRKSVYFLKDAPLYLGGAKASATIVNKFPGNKDLYSGAVSNYANSPKIFRIAEMYLIAAEASYQLKEDPNTTLGYLNTLREARGLKKLSGISGTQLFDEIKAERTRELAFEGYRLDDLKRWGEGFNGRKPQLAMILEPGEGFADIVIAPNHVKFTWGIPTRDQTVNPNLNGQQNEGW